MPPEWLAFDWRPGATGLALAATLLITFGLGLLVGSGDRLFRLAPGTPSMLAGGNPTAAGSGSGSFGQALASADRWRTVKLGVDDALQGQRDIELPVRERQQHRRVGLTATSRRSPADVVQELEQSGHVVKRERELWPIDLNDGRRLVLSRRTNRGALRRRRRISVRSGNRNRR